MNNISDVIEKLYNCLLQEVIKGFDAENIQLIANEYKKILENRYSQLNLDINDYNILYEKLFKIEYNEWSNLSLEMKSHILLKDDSLDQIINITSNAFKLAKDKLNNNKQISSDLANSYIEKLNELFDTVKDCNKQLANWHISEGILDLKYSSGQTNNMSMRIGHIK